MKTLRRIEIKPLGELLLNRGLISDEDLKNALALQQERREKLGRILIDLGYVSERAIECQPGICTKIRIALQRTMIAILPH